MRLAAIAAALLLAGCGQNIACLPSAVIGSACEEGRAYMLHVSIPTVVRPEIHVPLEEKIGPPP